MASKTRDRILECTLLLFNQRGEPNVTTLELATELGISPGNLYYHFHGKEPLVLALFERFQADLGTILNPPEHVTLDIEDYWLFLHLIVESMARYRFLFQDLSNLISRSPKLAKGIHQWLERLRRTLAVLVGQLQAHGQLISMSPHAKPQLVDQIILTLLFSLDFQRIMGRPGESHLVVYQVMMLLAPHLSAEVREVAEGMAHSYLEA